MASGTHSVDQLSIDLHSGEYVERYKAKPISRVRNLVPLMKLTRETRIADFACGNGMLLQAIGDNFQSYDGVDFSPEFVVAANEWAEETGRDRYAFHCCDIRDFCAEHQQTFDVATTLDFSEHIDDALAIEIYTAIRTSLRPGGRVYLHTPNLDFFMERARQIGFVAPFPEHIAVRNGPDTAALLVEAGFAPEAISVQIVPHYNIWRRLHPLSGLPLIGRLFAARLWITAVA